MFRLKSSIVMAGTILALGSGMAVAADPADTQAQLDAIKATIPKFAVPMREVGDRFQNMHFAAHGGNWALAAYMSKYMNAAMNPAKLTKALEYKVWANFYEEKFAPVNAAIQAKDLKAFDAAYKKVVGDCNRCHKESDYGFIHVVPLKAPPDQGVDYSVKSNPGDVPK